MTTKAIDKLIVKDWVLLVIVIANILITVQATLSKFYNWESSNLVLSISEGLFFIVWIYLLFDIIKQKIYSKPLWIILMIFLAPITPLFYVLQRNRLIRLGNKI